MTAASRPRVVLATEGTYPFATGGVSTWCHQLCEGLPEFDFTVLAVTGGADVARQYADPPGVVSTLHVPQWPGEEPAVFLHAGRYGDVMRRRWATSSRRVRREFVPPLRVVLREVLLGGVETGALVAAFTALGIYLRRYDYKRSMRDRATWEAFREAVAAYRDADGDRSGPAPTLADVTTCARWFYSLMMPLGVRVEGAALFHASIAASCALPGVVARQAEGTPFVLTEHGVYLRERYLAVSTSDLSTLQKRFLVGMAVAVGRACYAVADVVAPVAAFNTRWELPWGVAPERVRVIYNGVDIDRFRPRASATGRPARPTAVAAAHVFPLKDIETMIRAADVTRRLVPGARFVLYGSLERDPSYTARCRALAAELDLGEHFEFGGLCATPHELYARGDVSVLSSISEGFPYTVLESMACGVPCVATDVGGVGEAIGDTGVVVPPRDPAALGAAVAELLREPGHRHELARRARARVVATFTVGRQLEQYRGLYHELYAQRPRSVASRSA